MTNREVQYIQTYKDNFGHMHVRILYSVTQANCIKNFSPDIVIGKLTSDLIKVFHQLAAELFSLIQNVYSCTAKATKGVENCSCDTASSLVL